MARRPPTFHDFIGQQEAVNLLRRLLAARRPAGNHFPILCSKGPRGSARPCWREPWRPSLEQAL